jgi:maleylacetate reductase
MTSFVYTGLPARVVFGAGSLQTLKREIELPGERKVPMLSTPEQRASAERVADLLGACGSCV